MVIFHKTLNDALHAIDKGDMKTCRDIIKTHEAAELKEQTYIESSLYSIRLYLKNYISHLYMTIEELEKDELSEQERAQVRDNIDKCTKNIAAFEEAIKGLLKREGSILE